MGRHALDAGEGVGLDPLAVAGREVVDEEELLRALRRVDGERDGGAGAVRGDPRGGELAAGDAREAGAGPDAEDGADGEVGVDDGGAVLS